jgi:hypothetical protein
VRRAHALIWFARSRSLALGGCGLAPRMTDCLQAALWFISAGAVLACQATPNHAPTPEIGGSCLSETRIGDRYREDLEFFYQRYWPATRVTWSKDPALCRQALSALGTSQLPALDPPYVFGVSGAGPQRYILLWPPSPQSEWAGACPYDAGWKKVGICIGV